MPRSPSYVPKFRRHKASGQGFVQIDRRSIYLGPFSAPATREKYDRLMAEWLANGRRLPCEDPGGINIAELCLRFWEWSATYYRKPDGAPTSEREHYKVALRGLRHLYGTTLAKDFGPLDLKTVRDAWVLGRLPKMRGPASRKYANAMTARVKRVFGWAAENELVPAAVFQGVQVVKGLRKGRSDARESTRVEPVNREQVVAIRPYVSEQVWAMVQLQRLTGSRSGEIVILRPCDVDQSQDVWSYRPRAHKTSHHGFDREIFLGPKSQAVLQPYLSRPAASACFSPREAEDDRRAKAHASRKTPMSCGNRPGSNRSAQPKRPAGEEYTPDSYRRCIQRACERAGIQKWHPHQLRHTRATEIRHQAGLEAAQVLLGHQCADVTQVYAQRDRVLAIATMRELG